MVVEDRRYFFANTLAGVIATLGIPEIVRPEMVKAIPATPSYIAWMTIKVARMNVHSIAQASEAAKWAQRVAQAMVASGFWSKQHSERLWQLDKEQHFDQPVTG
jgi:hypothetical protein